MESASSWACLLYTSIHLQSGREIAQSQPNEDCDQNRSSANPCPVSYTHLDVYKRQVINRNGGKPGGKDAQSAMYWGDSEVMNNLRSIVAVSYTHLDVYKRQVLRHYLYIYFSLH